MLQPDAVPPPAGDGAPPSARLALLEALDRTGAGAGTNRQTPLADEQGGFGGLVISVALQPSSA